MSQEALVLAGVWCIGEFGDVLVKGGMNGGLLGAAEGEEVDGDAGKEVGVLLRCYIASLNSVTDNGDPFRHQQRNKSSNYWNPFFLVHSPHQ